MLKQLFIYSFLLTQYIYAQTWVNVTTDYINNPSFEEYYNCPQNTSAPSNYWIDSCKNWSHVTYASPDYLNSCANLSFSLVGVPNNFTMINKIPFHGNAYLGFLAYSLWGTHGEMWCEYFQSKILKNFISGKKYKFCMRIAPSKNNAYGISKIGVHFSQSSLSNITQQTSFKFPPTLLNSRGDIFDTTKWFLFEEEFIANGQEKYLTIGWFADTLTSDNGYFDSISNKIIYADTYYAVDSVNIMELNNIHDINNFSINIITPNNDGVNDCINFSGYNLSDLNFIVYNRWGNIVYSSTETSLKWAGINNKNEILNDGIYYYIINAQITGTKNNIQKTGYLSLIH